MATKILEQQIGEHWAGAILEEVGNSLLREEDRTVVMVCTDGRVWEVSVRRRKKGEG